MSEAENKELNSKTLDHIGIEILPVNVGQKRIHAKRIGGLFRNLKWIAASIWLSLFIGPYIRWGDRQAILFDLGERKFHIFGMTILPQDIWILAVILLFFALLLAVSTAIAGRVFCGYFCFQTVWTDVYTWIEEKIEGQPAKRYKLDEAPWDADKIKKRLLKHSIFLLIGFLTAFSFLAYFTDAFDLWARLFTGELGFFEWGTIIVIGLLTYLAAGILREQICTGVCPYSRIQGAMVDRQTVMPTYDLDRGEPRGRYKRPKPGEPEPNLGDCIDCNLCVAVCPTGVDIRLGQQYQCITCGLCIDACDSVMEKLDKPKGLIRYAAIDEFAGKPLPPIWKRPRVIVYTSIMTIAALAGFYALFTLSPIDLKVLHERAPLFVQMSDGTIQNKYTLKVVNLSDKVKSYKVEVSGLKDVIIKGNEEPIVVQPSTVGSAVVYLRAKKSVLTEGISKVEFVVTDIEVPEIKVSYTAKFIGPNH